MVRCVIKEGGDLVEYRLTAFDLLIEKYTDPIIVLIILAVLLSLFFCYRRASNNRARKVLVILALIFPAIFTAPEIIKAFSGWKWYGYEVLDGELHLKAWPVDARINLSNSEIFLTDSSEWEPKIRTYGMHAGSIFMGYHILKNGAKAVIFKHKESRTFLVINASGQLYIISHPKVDMLYREIKKRI